MIDLDERTEFKRLWSAFIWGTPEQYHLARRRYAWVCFRLGQEMIDD